MSIQGGIPVLLQEVGLAIEQTLPTPCNQCVPVLIAHVRADPYGGWGRWVAGRSTTAASPTLVDDVAGGAYHLSVQVIDTLGIKSPIANVTINVSGRDAQAPVISSVLTYLN